MLSNNQTPQCPKQKKKHKVFCVVNQQLFVLQCIITIITKTKTKTTKHDFVCQFIVAGVFNWLTLTSLTHSIKTTYYHSKLFALSFSNTKLTQGKTNDNESNLNKNQAKTKQNKYKQTNKTKTKGKMKKRRKKL